MNTRLCRVGLSCCLLLTWGSLAVANPEPRVPEVEVARPVVREVADAQDFNGRTEAASTVNLRARVTGYLVKTPFQEGAEVKEGDLLFEIDPRPYRAELDRADASLRLAEARLKLADAVQKRASAAFAAKAMSQEEFDKIAAERSEAEAGVAVARSVREMAQLNLQFTRVVAPISGQIGRRLVDPGNLVKADETTLGVIVSHDPMYVYFDIDERTYLRLARSGAEGKLKALKVNVALEDEQGYPHAASIDFVDNQVNPQNGTLRLRAVLPNKNKVLVPGLYVRVHLVLGEPHKVLLVPTKAVMVSRFEHPYVYVVNDKSAVEARDVTLGPEQNGLRAVTQGLKPEDQIIVGGFRGVLPGKTVKARQAVAPEDRRE